MKLGELSLQIGKYDESSLFFVSAVNITDRDVSSPSSAWLGVAIAELRAEKWLDSELALAVSCFFFVAIIFSSFF
jgi:hypothetical protein